MTIPMTVNGTAAHSAPGPSPASASSSQHSLPVLSQQPTSSSSTGTAKVLIVGGGPAGIVSLRNFIQDESLQGGKKGLDAVLYERREQVGGVWYLDQTTLLEEHKQGYPSNRWPLFATSPGPQSRVHYPSPCYPALIGNVIPRFLTFSGQPFPPPADQFPTLEETHNYLSSVAAPLQSHIRTQRDVKQVWELPYLSGPTCETTPPPSGGWLVHTLDLSSSPPRDLYEHFSAISFCPSFTTHPSYPNITGLAAALKLAPRKIHHAKWYRTIEPFWRSNRVIVVGNGLSSNDIAAQIVARRRKEWGEEMRDGEEKVLRALRHDYVDMFPSLPDIRFRDIPHIVRIDLRPSPTLSQQEEEPSLDITLASGEVVRDVDHIIMGTGYQIGVYDWVNVLAREPTQADFTTLSQAGLTLQRDNVWKLDESRLTHDALAEATNVLESLWSRLTPPARYPTSEVAQESKSSVAPAPRTITSSHLEQMDTVYPNRVPHLHSHIINARNPTLAFGALIISATPFVLADLVSRYIRLVWEAGPFSNGKEGEEQGQARKQGQGYLLPSTFEERRNTEVIRFSILEKTRRDLEESIPSSPFPSPSTTSALRDGVERRNDVSYRVRTKEVVTVNGSTLPSLPPSGLLHFHVLRDDEYPLQCFFKESVMTFKPWLRQLSGLRDEEWEEAEREGDRKNMYTLKRRWLEQKREAERAVHLKVADNGAEQGYINGNH